MWNETMDGSCAKVQHSSVQTEVMRKLMPASDPESL